jgi:CheY-like chemotaxis protein
VTADTDIVASDQPASVLVVEDEVLVRLVIAEYLRLCGYRVLEAANADEAVLVLKHPDFGIGVVFTDVDIPGSMDGFGLARWVRRHRPGLAVVLAGTLARAAEAAAELCENGPTLSKPYEPQVVADRIRRLLATQDPS